MEQGWEVRTPDLMQTNKITSSTKNSVPFINIKMQSWVPFNGITEWNCLVTPRFFFLQNVNLYPLAGL